MSEREREKESEHNTREKRQSEATCTEPVKMAKCI